MPTIKLPEESEHNDMVKKVDTMIREITKAPNMTASSRALGLRPSILIGDHQELAHIMAKRGLLNLQNHMVGLAVAAARAAPYELYTATFTDGVLDASQGFAVAGYYEEIELDDCSPECFGDRYWYYPVVVKVDRANHVVFQVIEQGGSEARFTSGDTRSNDVIASVTTSAGGSTFVLVAGEPAGGELVELGANGVRVDSRSTGTYMSERFSGGGCSQRTPVWQPRAMTASSGRLVLTGQLPAFCSSPSVPTDLDTSRTAFFEPTAPAVYNPGLRVPMCGGVSTTCDSGTLLNGRDGIIGGPEPNEPNTLGATCVDGISGTYHRDESIDRIRVFTSEGPLQQGRTAYVEVTVWAFTDYANDHLDLFSASFAYGSNWAFLTTLKPTRAGLQTLRASFILPPGSVQAVRAQFRYKGTNAECHPGGFNDRDDLVFTVADVARIDSALGAPRCSRVVVGCDSGLLLRGRGTAAGAAEPNQPNALGACADGSAAATGLEGAIDRIRVDHGFGWLNPVPGRPEAVAVEARIASTTDRVDLFYTGNAAAPVWTHLTTFVPSQTGPQTFSASYTLPTGTLQAVRASLRRQGAFGSCPFASNNDHDDLVFAVGQ